MTRAQDSALQFAARLWGRVYVRPEEGREVRAATPDGSFWLVAPDGSRREDPEAYPVDWSYETV